MRVHDVGSHGLEQGANGTSFSGEVTQARRETKLVHGDGRSLKRGQKRLALGGRTQDRQDVDVVAPRRMPQGQSMDYTLQTPDKTGSHHVTETKARHVHTRWQDSCDVANAEQTV